MGSTGRFTTIRERSPECPKLLRGHQARSAIQPVWSESGSADYQGQAVRVFDYAGQRQTNYVVSRNRVPTSQERQGNFQGAGVTIYDPATYNAVAQSIGAFPGNVIPANRFSVFGTRYINYFPQSNTPLVNGINYVTNLGNTTNYDQYLGRMDYNISSKDSLSGTVQSSDSPVLQPSIVNGLFGIQYQMSGKNAFLQETH